MPLCSNGTVFRRSYKKIPLRANLADPLSHPASCRPTRFAGWGPFFTQNGPRIGPPAPIAVVGVPIRPASTAIYSGRWSRCGSKTGLALAAFPSPSLPRRCNSSPLAAILHLATHRSEPRAPVAYRGVRQSAAAAHRAAMAMTMRRRRRSAAPMPRASAGRGSSPSTASGRRQTSTSGRCAPTKAVPSPALPHRCRRHRVAPAMT
jgi:hypothetical protein